MSLNMVIVLLTTVRLLSKLPVMWLNHGLGNRPYEGDMHRGKAVTVNIVTISTDSVRRLR